MTSRSSSVVALAAFNRRRVLQTVAAAGPLSRAHIALRTGLSRPAVSRVTGELITEGLLLGTRDGATAPTTNGGRPALLLSLAPRPERFLAAVLTRGRLRVALAGASGEVMAHDDAPLDQFDPIGTQVKSAIGLVEHLLTATGTAPSEVSKLTLGLPWAVDPATARPVAGHAPVHSGCRPTSWGGSDPGSTFRDRLKIPVIVENDANLAALGESRDGAGRGLGNVIYVKIMRGIGAGLILDGRLHHGAFGSAGEIAHVPVAADGPPCPCGHRGCLGNMAKGDAIVRTMHDADPDIRTFADVIEQIAAGDVGATRYVRQTGYLIGRVLADACSLLALEAVIVDGELEAAGGPIRDGISDAIKEYAQPGIALKVKVFSAALGEQAEIQGAIHLAIGDTPDPRIA